MNALLKYLQVSREVAKSHNFTTLLIKVFGFLLYKYHKNLIVIVHKMNIKSLSSPKVTP